MTNHRASVFLLWRDSLHRLRSHCWDTVRRSIRPNFSVHPVGKTMRWIEKWMPSYLMASTSSITMQSLGKIVQCAPAVGAKTWCFVSRTEAGALFVRQWHTLNRCCGAVYASILMMLTFFSIGYPFKGTREFWLLLLGGATIFTKLRTKISKSPQIGRKVGAHDFL